MRILMGSQARALGVALSVACATAYGQTFEAYVSPQFVRQGDPASLLLVGESRSDLSQITALEYDLASENPSVVVHVDTELVFEEPALRAGIVELPTDGLDFGVHEITVQLDTGSESVSLSAELHVTQTLAPPPADGLWWHPDRSGSGINVATTRDTIVITSYDYNESADDAWFQASGSLEAMRQGVPLYSFEGGPPIAEIPYTESPGAVEVPSPNIDATREVAFLPTFNTAGWLVLDGKPQPLQLYQFGMPGSDVVGEDVYGEIRIPDLEGHWLFNGAWGASVGARGMRLEKGEDCGYMVCYYIDPQEWIDPNDHLFACDAEYCEMREPRFSVINSDARFAIRNISPAGMDNGETQGARLNRAGMFREPRQ